MNLSARVGVLCLIVLLLVVFTSSADARAGGGRSYGGSSSYSGRRNTSNFGSFFGNFDAFIGIILILIGSVSCFYGYRVFKIMLGISGFAIGVIIALFISFVSGAEQVGTILIVLLLGAIGATLSVIFYFVGVFTFGGIASAIVFGLLLSLTKIEPHIAFYVISGILGGVFAIVLQRVFIVIGTAFQGAWYAAVGFASLLSMSYNGISILTFIFAAAGIIVQFKFTAIQGKLSGRQKKQLMSLPAETVMHNDDA